MKAITFSDKGKREVNQDLVLEYSAKDGSYLFCVIDGMGGYERGETAARIVSENIEAYLSTVETINFYHIQKAINKSTLAIKQKKTTSSEGMGATVGGVIVNGTSAAYFWVGDVKIFHFRNAELIFESTDHSLANELIKNGSLIDSSRLTKYKHIVTRSIHGDIDLSQAEIFTNNFLPETDLFIVCSDGVHDLYNGLQIETLLKNSAITNVLHEIESRLVNEATDNFSIGLVFEEKSPLYL